MVRFSAFDVRIKCWVEGFYIFICLGNWDIWSGMNYLVYIQSISNQIDMNSDQIPNFLAWETIHLIQEIFVRRLGK